MELKYTPFNISKLEEENGNVQFGRLIEIGTIGILRKFIKTGMNVDDMTIVDTAIQEFLDSGKTMNDLQLVILRRLEEDHFLERGVSNLTENLVKEQKDAIARLSENSGEVESQTQSE